MTHSRSLAPRARALAAVALCAASSAALQAHAQPPPSQRDPAAAIATVPPTALAAATFAVEPAGSDEALLLTVVVRRNVAPTSGTDLITQVKQCRAACRLLSQQVDPLPASSFQIDAGLSAVLRATWMGQPLVVDWRGETAAASKEVHTYVGTNHTVVLAGSQVAPRNATARLLGSGTPCRSLQALTAAAAAGAAVDALLRLQLPDQTTSIPGLSQGACP